MVRVTVSGSFHRHMHAVYEAVGAFRDAGAVVLSPSDPRVVDSLGDFLFVASDRLRSIKLVQDRHLEAIRASDLLWVVCPDGYTGPSVSMEIGAAYACGIPVFSDFAPFDSTLTAYVKRVAGIGEALSYVRPLEGRSADSLHVLLDPVTAIEATHSSLDSLKPFMLGTQGNGRSDAERELRATIRALRSRFHM
jgi:hypothetical protein